MFDEKDSKDKTDKILRYITWFLRISLLIAIIISIIELNLMTTFISSLILFLTFLPDIIESKTKIRFPIEFELVTIIFIYGALFLGEIKQYYFRYWWWDSALHTLSGLSIGFAGFIILYTLQKKNKIAASPFIISLFAFMFAIGIGGLWEIFEFAMDQIFGFNMQKSGLIDTMWDLILDSIGALITSIIGYFYLKGNKNKLFDRLVSKFVQVNPNIFKKNKKTKIKN
ncbi:MAG: hypothetical protein PHT94_02945 [Candidatus Nanoarchaeia archaeon]|nr:hypothetical protein [Candidatus Nanoarchaeia archaeon]